MPVRTFNCRGIPQSVNQDTAVESVSDMVEQNQMEDDMGSYSDDSFEDGSSSDEDQTDHLSSNCEKSHDATASPNDNRDTVKENKEKMSGDDELDSLDKELFGSLRQEKESVKSKPTTILLGTEETNLACRKSEPNGASGNVDQSKVRKEEGNVSSVSKSTSPHAKKKVRFAVKPEVFLVPFSSMEPVCYVSVVGDETTSTSDDCSPVLSNVFLDPYSMSFADDLDDRVNEMEEKTGKEELVLKGARQVKAVREANIAWSLGARGGRSTGASKEKKRLEVLLEMEELDEGQTSDGEEEQSSKAGKTCVTETSESSKKANEVMGHGSQKANEVTAHGPQKANKVTARGPQKGKRPKTEEAKALATMVEELNELHSKIGVIRKAFSGKMVPEVEKSAVKKKESFSRMTLLQQVKSIVTSIAQMSEDFNDGMQGALEESALHNENLERDLSEMKQEYLQALDDQDAKIKSLTEQNEELRDQLQDALDADPEYATLKEDMEDLKLQIKEMNQENESLTHMISTTNALNDNLWEQVDTLEEKLENCRSESQLTSLQVMGDEHPDVKSLKGKIQELEVQVDEGEMQRRHIEKEMEAMIVENEELFGRVSQLEKELKSSQSEGNGLRSKLEEMSRELCREKPRQDHKEGDSNPFSVSEGDSVEAKVLKERIRQLEFELEEEDLQRRAIGGLVESLNDENKNLRTQVCDLEETMKNSQSDTSDLQQNSLAMKHELSRRRSELEVKERELSNLRDSVTRKEIQCQKLLKLVSCYEEERRHTNEDIESAKKEFDECNANKQKLTIQVSELKNELLVMKKETLHSRQVFDFVHLREEAELLKGSIALGDRIKEERDQLQTSYQEKKRNVDELESHIAILKNDLGAERFSLKERAVELQQTKRCIEEKDKELQTVKTRLRKVEIELSQSKTELNEKGGKSGQENNHLQQRVVELESKLSEKHITLEKSSDELKESKKEMETVRALLDEKSANVEALKSAFEEKEALVARSKKEMESMRAFLDEKSAKVVALESVLEGKEVYITRHKKDFEKLSASLRDKDSQLQNAQQSAQVKDEEVNSIKSKLSEAERALQASVTLSKDQECSLKQERMKWKEDTKRLEAIVRRQQKDLKDWKGYLRSRDGELKALRLSLEDNKRKLESVNCLLDEKERKVGGFWKKLIKKQQVASKASSNAQSKLQRGKCLPAEMANVKRENVKLSAANAEIETRVKEMEANAKDENEDAMEKLNNALEHVKLQRNQIKELKVQLRKSRSDAHCSQDIVEKVGCDFDIFAFYGLQDFKSLVTGDGPKIDHAPKRKQHDVCLACVFKITRKDKL